MSEQSPDEFEQWAALADAPEETRRLEMRKRYEELALFPEDERIATLAKMAQAEYQLPHDKLWTFTRSRLLTWLEIDREKAKTVATSYDRAMQQMPASIAMLRVGVVQSVSRQFTLEQVGRLYELVPAVFREVPHQTLSPSAESRSQERIGQQPAPPTPFWKFWQRR